MKWYKFFIFILIFIFLDCTYSLFFNKVPLIRIKSSNSVYYEGLFTNSYKCNDSIKTVLKGTKYTCIHDIIDLTKNMKDFICADEEEIYRDNYYIYYLPCTKSKYIVIDNIDIKTALNNNIINISDLDKYNIEYIKKEILITITFDSKGGSKVESITINKGNKIIFPKDPTLNGYIFKYWVNEDNEIINDNLFYENTTLYAVWEKINNN